MIKKPKAVDPVSDDLKMRNSTELRTLSEQLSKIIERTGQIEDHLNTLEIAKNYRMEKKANRQKAKKALNDSDEFSLNGLDLDISQTSPNHDSSKSTISSQLAPFQRNSRRRKPEPTLREILLLINSMRKNVSELATRQNEMKFELEKIRARLC